MTVRISIGVLLALACASLVSADPPAGTSRPFWQHLWSTSACPPVGGCPDDYVRKPMPSICPLPCGGSVDDYCRKPLPCIPALPRCGTPDDYCRKPLPCLLCPPLTPCPSSGPCEVNGPSPARP